MNPMDPILAAYKTLQDDRASLDVRYSEDGAAKSALAKATNDAAVAANTLDADRVNFSKDKQALLELIATTLTYGPPSM